MKIIVTVLAVSVGTFTFSQNEQSKNLPPLEMLPKEGNVKQIYELPTKTEYKIYTIEGELLHEGNAQFIDYTDYKEGTYFVIFDGKKEYFEKK
jgi:hypothetical protein